jgi:hypothetical protein
MKLEYQSLGVFPKTHKKILKIIEKNGMKISYYIEFLIDEECKKYGLSDTDLIGDEK